MLLKISDPPVQAAIIVASTTLITVILGLVFKDYFIPGWVEQRSRKKTGEELLGLYRIRLFRACQAFLARLHEMYRVRSHYLWPEAPQSDFYSYKYKSSVYRLCVLLGWIRAYRLQEAILSFPDNVNRHDLSKAMDGVTSALADGQGVEMYVANAICRILKVEPTRVPADTLARFSVQIDHLVQKYTMDNDANTILDLKDEPQAAFIKELLTLATFQTDKQTTPQQRKEILKEVSIRLGLIYRDWQQAIGDFMIIKPENGDSSYQVIGYKPFEATWDAPVTDEGKKWARRAEKIFHGLDLRVDHSTDSRIQQLDNVYISTYNLLKELFYMEIGDKPVSLEDFRKIPSKIL